VPGIKFNGDAENGLYTVVNVNFLPNGRNEMLLFNLDINGISASGGSACSSGSDIGSHVIAQLPVAPESTSIRFSFSRYTTTDQIDRTIGIIKETYLVPAAAGGR
jgi:cysteine desulfurase